MSAGRDVFAKRTQFLGRSGNGGRPSSVRSFQSRSKGIFVKDVIVGTPPLTGGAVTVQPWELLYELNSCVESNLRNGLNESPR